MRGSALFLSLAFFGAWAEAALGPEDVLRLTLERPRAAYEGEFEVGTLSSGRAETRSVKVRYAPPGRWRREILDSAGKTRMIVVSDGRSEWVYDVRRSMAWKGEAADPDYKLLDPDEEYELILRNYELRLAGTEAVAGRRASVLEVLSRASGKPARRLWVGKDGLVLQRRAYSEDGSETSAMRFTRVKSLGKSEDADFSFSPPPGVRVLESRFGPDYMDLDEAEEASGGKPRLPAWLPPGYVFESVNVMPFKGASLLHTRFSDGVDALSLFQYPPGARLRLGWGRMGRPKETRVSGSRARLALTADNLVLEWKTSGHRFVLIGPLSAESMRRVAESVQDK
ncbi:MAG: hypothetical protein HY922_04610 [Elusimicrobia bacterium]|nr:hypothetical protein [Elusimicrobiota bacterium]